jgi:mannose-6-phosphate isomerase
MDVLQPVIRPYAWGSRDGIAELQGRPVPAAGPEAELWMGAHPSSPSGVRRSGTPTTLDALIAADPVRELGAECVERFGGRLPFLLKVLSAASALSIQVHPSRAQAEAGFAAEAALAPGDPARNYVDDWPKPELAYALTPFEVLAGMRSPGDAEEFLVALAVERLRPVSEELAETGLLSQALKTILTWPAADRAALIGDVVAACARLTEGPYGPAAAAIGRIAAGHPGDIGIVAALLLRHAVLEPGQAMFMPAGGLHAYLRGTCIELLANSDNVVRAGLTGKHIDVPELLKLLDPALPVTALAPSRPAPGIAVYDAGVPEFRLYRIDLGEAQADLPGAGPRILLCTSGEAVLRTAGDTAKLAQGESLFVSAADGAVAATGPARLFQATVGF